MLYEVITKDVAFGAKRTTFNASAGPAIAGIHDVFPLAHQFLYNCIGVKNRCRITSYNVCYTKLLRNGNISGQLKTVFDRCRAIFAKNPDILRKKYGMGLSVGGDRNGGQEVSLKTIHDFYILNGMIPVSICLAAFIAESIFLISVSWISLTVFAGDVMAAESA